MTLTVHTSWNPPQASFARSVLRTIAIISIFAITLPSNVSAQGYPRDLPSMEKMLTAPEWPVRDWAVRHLARRAPEISAMGLTRLIDLLRSELDGTSSMKGGETEDDEAYGQYIMELTNLVARFNDPRATAVLARQGIGITNNSAFQVAMSGDSGIGPLVASWNANADLRPAVVRTMGKMRYYADSTHAPLSASSRATIGDYLLRAATAPEPWVRHAFVDAVDAIGDPAYLPLISDISAHDTATIQGRRYIAADAQLLVPGLTRRRDVATTASLIDGLRMQQSTACRVGWIDERRLCEALELELRIVAQELARQKSQAARALLTVYVKELLRLRGREMNEKAYILLSGSAQYLVDRLGT